jgi:hypothetical protein
VSERLVQKTVRTFSQLHFSTHINGDFLKSEKSEIVSIDTAARDSVCVCVCPNEDTQKSPSLAR